ncbi:DUF4179 domain-containing protein [Bacillus sp. CGMCC 1.16607]|uniref:DUF4179 domain-containing protein n=1 Tax=Bacillus sp. CGMCC 1.16607 TaxID=3351842 RepID=UPI00363F8C7D
MKDIYELLNDVEIDEDDFEEMEVSEFERAKLKSSLKKSIQQKKKGIGWKRTVAGIAIICLSVFSVGLTFPAYAVNIPLIGDIFKFLDDAKTGTYDQYKEYSTEINRSKEGNGIHFTLNDAIFDGKSVSITYTIESDHALDVEQDIDNVPLLIIKGETGWSVTSQISEVGKNQYVGISTASTNNYIEKKAVKVKLYMPDNMIKNKQEKMNGNWNFDFELNATENNVQVIKQSSEQNGIEVEVEKLTFTPMSFTVYYNQKLSETVKSKWPGAEIADLQIKDNLGNSYQGDILGGWSNEEKEIHGSSKTFGKLDPKATKLIITPQIRLYKDWNRKDLFIGEETFILENIIVDLKK